MLISVHEMNIFCKFFLFLLVQDKLADNSTPHISLKLVPAGGILPFIEGGLGRGENSKLGIIIEKGRQQVRESVTLCWDLFFFVFSIVSNKQDHPMYKSQDDILLD